MISYNTWPEADKKRPKLQVQQLPPTRLRCACLLLAGAACDVPRHCCAAAVAACWPRPWLSLPSCCPQPSPPLSPRPHDLQAVAALLQQDTSAVVTLKASGIDRPAKVGFIRSTRSSTRRKRAP